MKKFIMSALVLTLAFTARANASTEARHYVYNNSQPQFVFNQDGLAASQRPFGVECSVSGFTKNKLAWAGSAFAKDVKNAYSISGIFFDPRMTIPDIGELHTFWLGSDISTTTTDTSTVDVKYKKTGFKNMYMGVTDGNTTEIAYCGQQYIDLDPPVAKKMLLMADGTELSF